jgi:hypothetical protein
LRPSARGFFCSYLALDNVLAIAWKWIPDQFRALPFPRPCPVALIVFWTRLAGWCASADLRAALRARNSQSRPAMLCEVRKSGCISQDRENVMLKAGQVLHDNDPRYRGRKVEVVRIEGSYAICNSGPRQVKVRLSSIFSDGEPRRTGYSTIAFDHTGCLSPGLYRETRLLQS